MADLQRRVRRAWFPPNKDYKTAVVSLKIHADGEVSNLAIKTTSSDSIFDSAALRAIKDAAPFRKLPDAWGNVVQLDLTFSLAHGDLSLEIGK